MLVAASFDIVALHCEFPAVHDEFMLLFFPWHTGKRLMKELDEKVTRGKTDLQTDIDLAVQPVRSENAQLRRYIIL